MEFFQSKIYFGEALAVHTLDVLALAWFCLCWFGYTLLTNHNKMQQSTDNLVAVMHQYRVQWMRQMLKRDHRITDMTGVGNLIRSISFFGSASIFLVLGAMGLMGYSAQAQELIAQIPFAMESPSFVWELKVFLLIIIFVHAFFKYTWTLRQYNYVTIYIGAAPGPYEHTEQHEHYAQRGAAMLTTAARHFNLGLRAYYYGFAVISWFIHPLAFMASTGVVIWVLYRREFLSGTFSTLRHDDLVFVQNNAS